MLRLITIALVVMFNSPEQSNSRYLLVEVADDSQVKNIETPGNGGDGNECKRHEDCTVGPNPTCENGYCLECYEDSDCPSETPLCDHVSGCGVWEDPNCGDRLPCRLVGAIAWWCMSQEKVCDGELDCPKGEDEKDCWDIQRSDDSASPDKQLLNPASNSSALTSREACGGRYDAGEKCVADSECNSYKCELDPVRYKGFRCEPCFGKKACHEPCQFNKDCCSKKCACGSPSEPICC